MSRFKCNSRLQDSRFQSLESFRKKFYLVLPVYAQNRYSSNKLPVITDTLTFTWILEASEV